MSMLELRNVTAGYGQFTALWGVDLRVDAGEAVAVVGPNGAGKTTLMRVISGLVPLRSGELVFEGRSLAGRKAHEIVTRGIAHVPEGRRIFPLLTVADNLKMGAFQPRARKAFTESLERVHALFPALAERQRQRAGSLSGGEQQMLAIGRALMSRPTSDRRGGPTRPPPGAARVRSWSWSACPPTPPPPPTSSAPAASRSSSSPGRSPPARSSCSRTRASAGSTPRR